jgi:hypothetical protein
MIPPPQSPLKKLNSTSLRAGRFSQSPRPFRAFLWEMVFHGILILLLFFHHIPLL